MAVLVEAISVLIRKDSIRSKISGGEKRFELLIPNATYCDDGELARVGFLNPTDVGSFIDELEEAGLTFMENGKCIDVAVCDQQTGLTTDCDWVEFGHLPIGGGKVGAAWLFEGERFGFGIHMSSTSFELATPSGWDFKDSLSDKFHFLPDDATRQ
jgi:hypothetical protein